MNEQSSKMKNLSEIFKNEILYQDKYDYYNKIDLNDIQNIINNMNDMYDDYSLIRYYSDLLLSVEKDCQDDFDELNEYTDYSNILKTKKYYLQIKIIHMMYGFQRKKIVKITININILMMKIKELKEINIVWL